MIKVHIMYPRIFDKIQILYKLQHNVEATDRLIETNYGLQWIRPSCIPKEISVPNHYSAYAYGIVDNEKFVKFLLKYE